MKRKILVIFLAITCTLGISAQEQFAEVEAAFGTFATDLSAALPFASTLGLNWSDSYIGQFPHFGIGATVGAVGLPAKAFDTVISTLTGGVVDSSLINLLPAEIQPFIEQFGMPFPSVTVDARIGGFGLPFDIGAKVGLIPDSFDIGSQVEGLDADYLLVGGDVRFRLIEERGLIPEISIGGGYNYYSGGIRFGSTQSIAIGDFEVPDPLGGAASVYNITLDNPAFGFEWETNVFDAKAQISKKILFITPYLGLGATYGSSKVKGGAYAEVGGISDPAEWALIEEALSLLGEEVPQLTETGFTITAETAPGFAARAFGGLSLDLLFLKLDVSGFYEIVSRTMGASVGLRLQF